MKRINNKIGNSLGRLGEDIACFYLLSKNFQIIDRNYKKKWGELDIVAKKGGLIHFVEVKSVSREINGANKISLPNNYHRPEENVHPHKIKRLKRALQTYILEKKFSRETGWVFDIITVFIDTDNKKAGLSLIDNVIL